MNINFTLISQAIAFSIFVWFTVKFVWPPLLRAIEERQKQIADGLAAGERGRKSLSLPVNDHLMFLKMQSNVQLIL